MASAELYQELILNLFLVLLILVGVGIYLSFQSATPCRAYSRCVTGGLERRGR